MSDTHSAARGVMKEQEEERLKHKHDHQSGPVFVSGGVQPAGQGAI